ncbi:uncharacterized protein LOC110701909 [Chenopodium quinoa]|uniref:uncharacterized protein LOC110701909 n=1 Tax=Chenopodium quinoa TaxID=63459 RepID=UPI000B76E6F3|nr:uncharacterized protein LOC110701909 [Chenopodium quinoa]
MLTPISNPLTKQSYRLPEPPSFFLDKRPSIDFSGIIRSVDDPAHYKVVLVKDSPPLVRRGGSIVRSSEFLKFYVFSSDTSSWCNFLVPAPPNFLTETILDAAIGLYPTALDGALYWCINMIMVYNLFDNVDSQHCDFIHLPQEAKNSADDLRNLHSLCIANIEQRLWLYHWSFVTAFTQTLTVWDLKDDRTWNIKHFVDLTSINWRCKHSPSDVNVSIKGFDPYDGDVLYVFSKDDRLLSVNLRSKTVQLVFHFKSTVFPVMPHFRLFPYFPPFWPTPIIKSIVATAAL